MRLKIKYAIIAIVTAAFSLFISCSKNSNVEPQIDPTGNFEGTISVYSDGNFVSSMNNAKVVIGESTIKGKYSIITSPFMTLNATISNGSITIPSTVTNSGIVSMKEFGNGKINGNTLTFDITQELSANGQISTTLRYTFNGIKK